MDVTFIGSGDAFGSGGRFNTCFLLRGRSCHLLVDCGATSLVALKHHGVAPNDIDGAVISHLHGDHFGGLPFLLLDGRFMSKRQRPFFLYGPAGLAARLATAQDVLFPGSGTPLGFDLAISELTAMIRSDGPGFSVTPFPADHSAGAPCFSLRIEMDGKIVTYSGDTAWTATLAEAARGADLFICECSSYARPQRGHLDYANLAPRLPAIGAKRIIITHMNPDMLAQLGSLAFETASDGLTVTV